MPANHVRKSPDDVMDRESVHGGLVGYISRLAARVPRGLLPGDLLSSLH